ncbi:hypothetical protein [Neobacillus vireti]|uniref:hypothetical protein n=1 Tax=Neobacillus vireti TaxID=220686 RepID=UPI002FFED07F
MRYNDRLKELHEQKRIETINQIEYAIDTIKALEGDNAAITALKICNYSGLSRAALYKEHALKIWNPVLWSERYEKKTKIEEKLKGKFEEDIKTLKEEINTLNNELLRTKSKLNKVALELEDEKKRSHVYKLDAEELKLTNKKLLGECQRLHNKLVMHGIQDI